MCGGAGACVSLIGRYDSLIIQDGYSHIRLCRTANYIFSKVIILDINDHIMIMTHQAYDHLFQDDQIVNFDDLLSFDELNDQKVTFLT